VSQAPNSSASTKDFEFAALNNAANYRQALLREFSEFLRGDVVEVGAGIGQITEPLSRMSAVRRVVAVEPDPEFCAQHRSKYPDHELIEGTANSLQPDQDWDAVLSVNVLEHIGERHRSKKHLDLPAQLFPEIVRETASRAAETAFRTVGAAASRFDRLIDRDDDVGNPHFGSRLSQAIAASRPTRGRDQTAAAQFSEQLLEIGQRNFLPARNFGQGNVLAAPAGAGVPRKIGHRHHGVTPSRA